MRILIPREIMTALYNHSERALPNECVILLFGNSDSTDATVRSIAPVQNTSTSPLTSFKVDPEEEYKLLVEREAYGEEMVGIYHSHPAPPSPSSRDLRFMRVNQVTWVIASKITGQWESAAYIFTENEVKNVEIVTI